MYHLVTTMTSEATDKYHNTGHLSAKHKLAILICFSVSAAIIFAVFMFNVNSGGKNTEESSDGDHDHEDDYDDDEWWMEEQDLIDEWEDY